MKSLEPVMMCLVYLLPDGAIVDVDTCLAWLQDSVYQGCLVSVEAGWVEHQKGIVVDRSS